MGTIKDWHAKGSVGVFSTNGDSSHSETDRNEHDYYATDPKCLERLLDYEDFNVNVWEPACGGGHLSGVLKKYGYRVRESDITDRIGNEILDFIDGSRHEWDGDIITNPPYSKALEFAQSAIDSIGHGRKIAMFLKLTFLESRIRAPFFRENPPKKIYVFIERQKCAPNGDFESIKYSAVCYAWFIWEKGFRGDPSIKWL